MFRLRNSLAAALLTAASLVALVPPQAMADQKDFDWVVNLKTEEQKGVLDFKGAKFKNPVKVRINYYEGEKGEDSKVEYEDMWFGPEGKPLGQEKFHEYKIRPAEQTLVKVEQKDKKPMSLKECQAAGDAILRFYLDASLHGSWVTAIKVPADAYDNVRQYFEDHNFTQYQMAPPDVQGQATKKILLFLTEDVPSNARQTYLEHN